MEKRLQEIQTSGKENLGTRIKESYPDYPVYSTAKGIELVIHEFLVKKAKGIFEEIEDKKEVLGVGHINDSIKEMKYAIDYISNETKIIEPIAALFKDVPLKYNENRLSSTVYHSAGVTPCSIAIAYKIGLRGEYLIAHGFASLVHDVGKVKCLDIIAKERKLTDEEFEKVKKHPRDSQFMIEDALYNSNFSDKCKDYIYNTVGDHHERWDGSDEGYLNHKKGKEISIGGRILTIADGYEASTTRPSRRFGDTILTPAEFWNEMILLAGTKYDPNIVYNITEGFKPAFEKNQVIN